MRALITGTGMYVPPLIVDNHRLSKIMDTTDEWIRVRTGIETRHYTEADQSTSDLALPAARDAIAGAGLSDEPVSAEEFARNTATRDRTVLFGDGAGAVVVSASEDQRRGVIDTLLHTNGAEWQRLWTAAGGSAYRPYFHPDMHASGDDVPMVEGRKVYALAVTHMPQARRSLTMSLRGLRESPAIGMPGTGHARSRTGSLRAGRTSPAGRRGRAPSVTLHVR